MTWQPTLTDTSKPKYLALVEILENDIAAGVLRHGERLPPQREIAERLDITIATITKAIREAARRGIVTAKTGSGTFVRVGEDATAAERTGPDLSLNTVPLSPTKSFLDAALMELAKRRGAEALFAYEPAAGSDSHRALMARWLKERDLFVQPAGLLVTHGGQQALSACLHVLTRPGDTILCERWTYTGILRLAALTHVTTRAVEMDEDGLDPDSLEASLRETGAKVVVCTATVQNPTTATMPLDRRKRIVAVCRKAAATLIEDDIYGILSGEKLPPLASLNPRGVVHIGSVSKCIAPSMRLGTIVAPNELLSPLANALTALHWTAPTFWAEMFGLMLEAGLVERCLSAHRKEAHRRLALYEETVGTKPSTTLPSYHVWQKVPPAWRTEDFVSELLTSGVRVSPAQHFSADPTDASSNQHVRVCLGGSDDIEALREPLQRVRNVLQGGPRQTSTVI